VSVLGSLGNHMEEPRFTAEYWLELAEEALARASQLRDAEARQSMLAIAMAYRRMKEQADEVARLLAEIAPQSGEEPEI